MPKGGCLCGQTTITYDAEPAMKALCHCSDCQYISGTAYSANIVIPDQTFKFTGEKPKEHQKVADSGKKIVSYFCENCGTTLARVADAFPGMVVIKAGVVDGGLEQAKPDAELFSPNRVSWVGQIPTAGQLQGME